MGFTANVALGWSSVDLLVKGLETIEGTRRAGKDPRAVARVEIFDDRLSAFGAFLSSAAAVFSAVLLLFRYRDETFRLLLSCNILTKI